MSSMIDPTLLNDPLSFLIWNLFVCHIEMISLSIFILYLLFHTNVVKKAKELVSEKSNIVDSFIFKSVYIGVVSLLFIFGCRSGDTQRQASHGTNVKE